MEIAVGVMLPFLGTALGAAFVFLFRTGTSIRVQKWLLGFSAGIMLSASMWSLLIPAIKLSTSLGKLAFVPAVAGVILGVAFLMMMDKWISHLYKTEKTQKLLFAAVAFHNIPEGMVVGAAFAGATAAEVDLTLPSALVLSLGIAIQNIPEGAIISLPLKASGRGGMYAWFIGALSGIIEPVAAVVTLCFFYHMKNVLPYMLSLAAGAMIHVVVKELLPDALGNKEEHTGYMGFVMGFLLMMILDIAFA